MGWDGMGLVESSGGVHIIQRVVKGFNLVDKMVVYFYVHKPCKKHDRLIDFSFLAVTLIEMMI